VTVRYQVPVSAEALAGFLPPPLHTVRGLRFVSSDGLWGADPRVVLCTFEDDEAPPELDGQLVDLTLSRTETPDGPLIEVLSRSPIPARPGPI
jgi:hypothetical protein